MFGVEVLADEELVEGAARVRAALEQDEVLAAQIVGHDAPLARQRVGRRGDEEELLLHGRDGDEVGRFDGQGEEAAVGGAGADGGETAVGRARPDLDLRLRVGPLELAEQGGEDVEADRHPADQPHRAAQGLARVADQGDRVLQILEDAVTELEQRFTRRRDADAPADAEEDGLVQLLFEQEDLPADRRLRHVQPFAGSGEGAGFGDRADDFELTKIHAHWVSSVLHIPTTPDGSSASRPTSTLRTTPALSTTKVARRATPELVVEQAVGRGRVALPVAQDRELDAELLAEGAVRPGAVDADAQDLGVGRGERPVRRLVLLHLVGAAGRERGREERDDDVLLALEVGQLDPLRLVLGRVLLAVADRREPGRDRSRGRDRRP